MLLIRSCLISRRAAPWPLKMGCLLVSCFLMSAQLRTSRLDCNCTTKQDMRGLRCYRSILELRVEMAWQKTKTQTPNLHASVHTMTATNQADSLPVHDFLEYGMT